MKGWRWLKQKLKFFPESSFLEQGDIATVIPRNGVLVEIVTIKNAKRIIDTASHGYSLHGGGHCNDKP